MEGIWLLKITYVYIICSMRALHSMESLKLAKQGTDCFGLVWFWPKESGKGVWNCKSGWKLKGKIADKKEIHKDPTLYVSFPSNACLISKLHIHERDAKDTRVKTVAGNLKEMNKGKVCNSRPQNWRNLENASSFSWKHRKTT